MNQGNLTEPGIIALLLFIKCQAQQKGLNQSVLREPLFGAQNMGIGRGQRLQITPSCIYFSPASNHPNTHTCTS